MSLNQGASLNSVDVLIYADEPAIPDAKPLSYSVNTVKQAFLCPSSNLLKALAKTNDSESDTVLLSMIGEMQISHWAEYKVCPLCAAAEPYSAENL